mgnify:CR=1 FL=1
MKQELLIEIEERASNKIKDGIYTFRGIPYVVVNQRLRFFAEFDTIFQMSHGFVVTLGKYEYWQVRIKLAELLKKF